MKLLSLVIYILLINSNYLDAQVNGNSWKLYDDFQVAVIKVTMSPEDYNLMMDNPHSDDLKICSITFSNKYIDTTLADVGIRIRGNTSRDSKKKSFKLSFNDFVPGRNFFGVDKMNINGEHNDPSIIRSKICWDIFQKAGIKASRAAHVALFINDVYHGLYISVEHIDDEFLQKIFRTIPEIFGNAYTPLI